MRQSSSTMTSAHTAIDEGRQYVFMSSELESEIDLSTSRGQSAVTWEVILLIKDSRSSHVILSIEQDNESYILQLQAGSLINLFTSLLIDSAEFSASIQDRIFKAKVSKLESDRAYLKLSR